MKVCAKCVLPESFPGIKFNSEGVCNYCLENKRVEVHQKEKSRYELKFRNLILEKKNKGCYDVILAYSGGKDSTYTLELLQERYNLNILAVTFDNGFISGQTNKNIMNVVENLGIDHIFFKPSFKTLSLIFNGCVNQDIFSAKTLERASTICTACMAIIKFTTLRMAIEKEIPFIAFGWSPGQAPIGSSIMKNNPQMVKMMQRSLFNPLYKLAGDKIKPYFLDEKYFSDSYNFPYNVHPLAFLEYNEGLIYESIARLNWIQPKDVDANSTNCLLNSYANVVHKNRHEFNPYSFELANLVREGYLDRSAALERLERKEDPEMIKIIEKRLASF
jgi:tRNA(Ile)-lysidine synthase TilS/MesJ